MALSFDNVKKYANQKKKKEMSFDNVMNYVNSESNEVSLPTRANLPTATSQILSPNTDDATTFGTFSNGYQPKGISGHGTLSKTGKTINVEVGESDTYNELTGKKDKIFNKQNIWQAEDGTTWVWNGATKTYKPYGQTSTTKEDTKNVEELKDKLSKMSIEEKEKLAKEQGLFDNEILMTNPNDTGLMTDINKQKVTPAAEQSLRVEQQILQGARYHKEQESQQIFKSGAFDDGYQFGDVTKTILGTTEDAAINIGKGAVQLGQGIGKTGAYGVAQIADWAGNSEYAEKVRRRIAENPNPMISKVEDLQRNIDANSILGDKADQVLQSVGYTSTLMGVQGLGGTALNNLTMFLSSTGDSISDTLQENPNAKNWQVWLRSGARGGMSVLTESLGGIFGKNKFVGGLEDKAYQALTAKMLDGAGKVLTRLGIDATSEALEEFIEYAGDQLIDLGVDGISSLAGSDSKFYKDWDWNEIGESMAMAFASTMLLNGTINATKIAGIKAEAKKNGQNISTKDAITILAQQIDTETQENIDKTNLERAKKNLEKTIKQEQKKGNDTTELKSQLNQIDNMLGIEQKQEQVDINKASQSNISELNNQGQQVSQESVEQAQNQVQEQTKQQTKNVSKISNINTNIDTYSVDSHDGQTDYVKEIKDKNNNTIARLEYSKYEGSNYVNMIEVDPEYRRLGLATKLLQDLQAETPNNQIIFGMTTPDGTKLINSITEQVKNPSYNKKIATQIKSFEKQVNQIREQIEEYNNKLRPYAEKSKNGIITEEEMQEWRSLSHEQTELIEKEREINEKWYKLEQKVTPDELREYNTFVKSPTQALDVSKFAVNNLENNYNLKYNTVESESGNNGKDSRGIRVQNEINERNNKTDFSKIYRTTEEEIRNNGETIYSEADKEFARRLKEIYNKQVFIFDDNAIDFGGGLSTKDDNIVYFGKNALKNYGYDFLEGHEIAEDMYKNHKDISEKIINNYIDKIQSDSGFGNVFLKYLNEVSNDVYEYYIDKPQLIAKEIICDLNGYLKSNFDIKDTIFSELDSSLIKDIQKDLTLLENRIYKGFNDEKNNLPESEVSKNGEQVRTETNRLQEKTMEGMGNEGGEYFERVKELTRNIKKELSVDRANLNSAVEENLQSLPISKTKTQKFIRELANNKFITKEDIRKFVEDNNIYTEKTINEELAEIRKDISGYGFKLNDILKSELRYKYGKIPRNIKLDNNGLSVDSIYQELSDKYPGIFSDEIINEAEQAAEIIEFMRNVSPVSIEETKILTDDEINSMSELLYAYKQAFDEAKNYYNQKFLDEKRKLKDLSPENIEERNTPKKLTRKAVREQIINDWGITAEDLSNAKDLIAINYQLIDPVRVNEKVFGRKLGQKINDLTVNQTKHNTAEKIRWLNKERAEIEELGIKARTKESAAVQKYGEKQFVDKNGDVHNYGDAELASEFSDVKTQEKIKKAAAVIRNKYDTYIDQINEVLTSLGYDAIPKRQDYMRHFQELGDIFSQTGVPFNLNDMKAEDLPTDINGLTEFNRPGKNWFASAQKRYGNKTTYDAITGIDGYLEGAGNLIFHTQDIQNYRALSSLIRDSFGASKGFDNLEGLSEAQAQNRIDKIMNNYLSKYVAWLDEQANSLAGKKGKIDRGFEQALGRRSYKFMNTLKSQVGSNMTGYNARSAMTNFISTTIAAAKTKKLAMVKGTVSTIQNMLKNDGFIDKSDFLTARFGSDSLSQKLWQKASNAGQVFMTASDYFTSNLIVRSKYFEGLQKGMTESEAIKYADDFGARVMGDRSQGATAEAFNSKTLGLLTQFQLETNNQWQYMIHDTIMDYQKNSEVNGGLKAGATALFQLGQLAAFSYFFNEMFEKLTGSRAAFDPLDILKKLFGDDDDKDFDKRLSEAGAELVDSIPFGNLITGGGRIPISEAFTGISTLGKKFTDQKDKYNNEITWEDVGKDLKEALPYWILPTGYSQLKKTTQGLSMYDENLPVAGSYTDSGNLRYTVDEDTASKLQAALFGKWANELAQEYIDSGYKTINKNKVDELKDLGMTSAEYREYRKGMSEQSTQQEKLEYINSLDVTDSQKSIMASNELKRDIDMSTYDDFGSYEEFDFSYKNPEKYSWLEDNNISYKKYKNNKEAFDYAYKNPEKYDVSQLITNDFTKYYQYKQDINDIKADNTTSRKNKVEQYVNNLNLNVAQKAMLIKSTTTYKYDNYNSQIVNYIDGLNISSSKKKKYLEELGFQVDSNMNVTW